MGTGWRVFWVSWFHWESPWGRGRRCNVRLCSLLLALLWSRSVNRMLEAYSNPASWSLVFIFGTLFPKLKEWTGSWYTLLLGPLLVRAWAQLNYSRNASIGTCRLYCSEFDQSHPHNNTQCLFTQRQHAITTCLNWIRMKHGLDKGNAS